MMTKIFFQSFLFIVILVFYSCNTRSSQAEKEENNQVLAAVSIPEKEVSKKTPIDFFFKTTVIEADLPSPRKEMSGHIADLKIKVNYGSPSVKGREIWGELVPFDKIWRTGANEATTFTIDKDITLNEQTLNAGTYSLFTLPTSDGWKMIFNTTIDQWGAYEYEESKDVLRVSVIPQTVDALSEMMEFIIDGDQVILLWGNLSIPIIIGHKS